MDPFRNIQARDHPHASLSAKLSEDSFPKFGGSALRLLGLLRLLLLPYSEIFVLQPGMSFALLAVQ
jgi:hypothetical protein